MSEKKSVMLFRARREKHAGQQKEKICTCRYQFGSCGSSSGYSRVKCRACVVSELEKGGHRFLSREDEERFSIGSAHLHSYDIEPGRNECTCMNSKVLRLGTSRSFKQCRNKAIRGLISHGEVRLYCKKHSN